jgi:hypothetical protein
MFEGYKILNTVTFMARLLIYYFMNYYNVISNETIENVTLHPWKFKMKQFSSDLQGWTQSIPCKFWLCLKIIFKS